METRIPDGAVAQITELLYLGRKIEAIKIVREETRTDLLQAKLAVEAFETELRQQHPEKFAPRKGCGGGAAALLILLVIVGVGVIVLV